MKNTVTPHLCELLIYLYEELTYLCQVLVCENGEWKMMTVDESKPHGRAPPVCQRLLKMAPFHIAIQLLVLVNAIVAASMHFDHRTPTTHSDYYSWYYYTEVNIMHSLILLLS